MQIDLKVAQLLCSRVCHDLIGPVGAVSAGLELLSEDPTAGNDAIGLMADSATTVAGRLAYFRVAFGLGGATGPTAVSEARTLAVNLLDGGKVVLDWPEDRARSLDGTVPPGGIKLLLCLVFLAGETLPRGGKLAVRTGETPDGPTLAITASGTGARLRDGTREAMAADAMVDDLTAQTVTAHFAAQLARSLGTGIGLDDTGTDEIRIAAPMPRQ